VLDGIRIIEIAGIGPGPFCGMLLADMGAEVILVERAGKGGEMLDLGQNAIVNRGKRSLALDLKDPRAIDAVLRLIADADALIEGMRPGVMERLGLGPAVRLARNPRLIYGRMTGWGQDGPLASAAGHDLDYIALSGALWFAGVPGSSRSSAAAACSTGRTGMAAMPAPMAISSAWVRWSRSSTRCCSPNSDSATTRRFSTPTTPDAGALRATGWQRCLPRRRAPLATHRSP